MPRRRGPELAVNATDLRGATALHHFSAAGRSDLVQLLLKDPRTPLDAVKAEKNRERKPWDPAPKLAKYDEVIALLTRAAKEKKTELEKLCPPELSNHPGTWAMAVNSLLE
eukprot:Skav228218  [mRNA]  locus=scaffold43:211610:214500:- [translate_table: standard]